MSIHHSHCAVLTILTCGLSLLGSAGPVAGQPAGQTGPTPVAHSFDELKGRIQPGATILVTDSAGHEVSGKLGELSDTSLNLLLDGKPRAFSPADVTLVSQRQSDSLWNGLLIGAAAGAAPAVYWLFADPNECGGSICMTDLAIGVIPGAAIGLGIDAAIKKRVIVYSSPSRSSTGTAFTVEPILSEHRKGIGLTMFF